MKTISVVLFLIFSSSAFAGESLKMESYECGLQVGKLVVELSKTKVSQDINNLAADIESYPKQSNLSLKLKGDERLQVEQAARNTWHSILYSIDQIKSEKPEAAAAIEKACEPSY